MGRPCLESCLHSSQPNLLFRGYLATSGDIFSCHNWWDWMGGGVTICLAIQEGIQLHTLKGTRQVDTVNKVGSNMFIVWSCFISPERMHRLPASLLLCVTWSKNDRNSAVFIIHKAKHSIHSYPWSCIDAALVSQQTPVASSQKCLPHSKCFPTASLPAWPPATAQLDVCHDH